MKRPGVQDIGLAVCFLLLAVIALRPSGVVGGRVRAWNAERQVLAVFREEGKKAAATRKSILGSGDAAHVIFEFSDYRCPFCRLSHETVNEWATGDSVKVVLVHVPPLRPHARGCAGGDLRGKERGVPAPARLPHDERRLGVHGRGVGVRCRSGRRSRGNVVSPAAWSRRDDRASRPRRRARRPLAGHRHPRPSCPNTPGSSESCRRPTSPSSSAGSRGRNSSRVGVRPTIVTLDRRTGTRYTTTL